MNLAKIVDSVMDAALTCGSDAEFNRLSRLANRLEHYGLPFEKELTNDEIKQISLYI
jgi:hypothetical protein